jgi:hypothetical protein
MYLATYLHVMSKPENIWDVFSMPNIRLHIRVCILISNLYNNSILIYLLVNLRAQRPITKLARVGRKKQQFNSILIYLRANSTAQGPIIK